MPSDITVIETSGGTDTRSYVDWPAIFAGIAVAVGISIVLLTFGSAIGLSFANFRAHEGVNPVWIGIAAASWLLWVQISSFMAGGYLTGRMRRRANDATEHEADVRDGAHGLIVWGGSLVIGALIAVSGLGAAATAVGNAAGTLTTAASNVAGGAAEAAGDMLDPNAYFIDTLYRAAPAGNAEDASSTPAPADTTAPAATPAPATTETPASTTAPAATTTDTSATTTPAASATPAPAASSPAPAAMAPAANDAPAPANLDAVRAETSRIFVNAATSELSDNDRAYLVQLVSANTGLSQEEAQARVDETITAMDTAKAQAADVAEKARKTAVLAAFLTAASLLVSAAGAFWAAQMGGNHRDQGTVFAGFGRRRV
jgi:hypothetical protein